MGCHPPTTTTPWPSSRLFQSLFLFLSNLTSLRLSFNPTFWALYLLPSFPLSPALVRARLRACSLVSRCVS